MATPEKVETILTTLESLFRFNPLVILPPLIVLYGSIRKKPTIPVMLISSVVAFLMRLFFKDFPYSSVLRQQSVDSVLTW